MITPVRNPIVWVTQEMSDLNYTPANVYGDVRFITGLDFSTQEGVASIKNPQLVSEIEKFAAKFDDAIDYLVPSGSVFVSMVACAALAKRGIKKVAFLRWNHRKTNYDILNLGI